MDGLFPFLDTKTFRAIEQIAECLKSHSHVRLEITNNNFTIKEDGKQFNFPLQNNLGHEGTAIDAYIDDLRLNAQETFDFISIKAYNDQDTWEKKMEKTIRGIMQVRDGNWQQLVRHYLLGDLMTQMPESYRKRKQQYKYVLSRNCQNNSIERYLKIGMRTFQIIEKVGINRLSLPIMLTPTIINQMKKQDFQTLLSSL